VPQCIQETPAGLTREGGEGSRSEQEQPKI